MGRHQTHITSMCLKTDFFPKKDDYITIIIVVNVYTQDSETNDVVRIAYTETFREVYDYFRAILKLNEKSMRAFELSKDAALLNPANYTVWYYRRILIRELKLDLKEGKIRK